MEEPAIGKENEKKHRGGRLMGKLFKQEKKPTSEVEVDEFLYGPSDKLFMMPTTTNSSNPPPLTRIDTANASRWPTAAKINTSIKPRGRSASPKRSRKGLVVRFYEGQPEIIGEGGDESTTPVSEIGMRKRAQSHPPSRPPHREPQVESTHLNPPHGPTLPSSRGSSEEFRPEAVRRAQTGFESIPGTRDGTLQGDGVSTAGMRDDPFTDIAKAGNNPNRRSFADLVKAEMGSEGRALVQAAQRNSIIDQQVARPDLNIDEAPKTTPQLEQLHLNTMNNVHIPVSPGYSTRSTSGRPRTPNGPQNNSAQISNQLFESPSGLSRTSTLNVPSASPADDRRRGSSESSAALSRTTTLSLQEAAMAVGDDAVKEFSRRTAHMFTLFRLSAEAVKPVPQCSLEDLVRASLWWFLKGRLNLEATIRDRPASPHAQQNNFFVRQQAYTDLAKALWIVEIVTSRFPETELRPGSTGLNAQLADILESRQSVLSGLRKLTMSMKRNNFLPPDTDNAPLTQGLDPSIWVQDEGDRSLLASQRLLSVNVLSESFPLGDTTRSFHFGRMFLTAVILEDAAAQHYRCPVLLSLDRSNREKSLTAVITSQGKCLNFVIQADKTLGPTWTDVKWQAKQHMVELRLPRGFTLQLHCSETDFRTLWAIHDYENRIHGNMHQRPGEDLVFESTVRTFQYFEQTSRPIFTKEPQPQCHLRLYEKSHVEKAATGPRTMHRGFRICLVTNPKTKNLRGIDQELPPNLPTLFSFLRGDGGLPALMLKIFGSKSDDTMVFTFEDINERTRLHQLLTGVALRDAEDIIAEAPVKALSVTARKDMIPPSLKALEWQSFRFINTDHGDIQGCKTVLSEQLRVAIDFKCGTITDRINVEPAELKLRLDVTNLNELKIHRLPQEDMTISVSESQAPKELPKDLAALLEVIKGSETTRSYTFPSKTELHLFQSALTGFVVLFDGVASSFNISRRRMVVPIYKKWDAAHTRIQIVQKDKVIQLVAFFEGFSHGDCMNFALKSTDIFETSTRGGKYSLRIVDAKFALPKPRTEEGNGHEFVCLDMPEYPGEHDDITIFFENETALELFTKALPAPVKAASRMPSVRR